MLLRMLKCECAASRGSWEIRVGDQSRETRKKRLRNGKGKQKKRGKGKRDTSTEEHVCIYEKLGTDQKCRIEKRDV